MWQQNKTVFSEEMCISAGTGEKKLMDTERGMAESRKKITVYARIHLV